MNMARPGRVRSHIQMEDTEFDDAIDPRILGAGILPVSVGACGVRLLLGKERYITHWRGSLKWSGFEGGRKQNEAVERTAAREFLEESMGTVPIVEGAPIQEIDDVVAYLRDARYFAKLTLCILNDDTRTEEDRRYHVTYVVQVKEPDSCVGDFLTLRNVLLEIQAKALAMEKLMVETGSHPPFLREGMEHDGHLIRAVCEVTYLNSTLTIGYVDQRGYRVLHEPVRSSEKLTDYLKWFQLRVQLNAEIAALPHENCIEVKRNMLGMMTRVSVVDDFIEKQHIQWWGIKELKTVLYNGGYTDSEFFRAYFLPVLQRSLEELETVACN